MVWTIERRHLQHAERWVQRVLEDTPFVEATGLGDDVWLKLELEQPTQSFKVRGAVSAVAGLRPAALRRGVVTASGGNHGLGLAWAARRFGAPALVYASALAPRVKVHRMEALGARVQVVGGGFHDAERAARADASGALYVSAFDDPYVAAGNGGTLAVEVGERWRDATLVIPVGGGGLLSGALAANHLYGLGLRIVGVQTTATSAMADSLKAGAPVIDPPTTPTLAEGLEGGISESTFRYAATFGARVEVCSEDDVRAAIRWAHEELGLTVEGSAATTLAWARRERPGESAVVLVLTGANLDPARRLEILRGS